MSTSEMRRGIGGRIEEAFASAKENGKAAFVSFITAGYPSPEGESKLCYESPPPATELLTNIGATY